MLMRLLAAALPCLILASGAASCSPAFDPPIRLGNPPHADLSELKGWAKTSGMHVEVTEKQSASTGPAHAGGAAAALYLVILVADRFFGDRWQDVLVRDASGRVVLEARYDADTEEFMDGIRLTYNDDSTLKEGAYFRRLTMRGIRKCVDLQTEQITYAPGTVYPPDEVKMSRSPISIVKQIDVLADYRKAIAESGQKRIELVAEAIMMLQDESLPLVLERLRQEEEEKPLAQLLEACKPHLSASSRAVILRSISDVKGSPLAAGLKLFPSRLSDEDAQIVDRWTELISENAMGAKEELFRAHAEMLRQGADGTGKSWATKLRERIKGKSGSEFSLLRIQCGDDPSVEEVATALDGPETGLIMAEILLKEPSFAGARATVFEALSRKAIVERAQAITHLSEAIQRIAYEGGASGVRGYPKLWTLAVDTLVLAEGADPRERQARAAAAPIIAKAAWMALPEELEPSLILARSLFEGAAPERREACAAVLLWLDREGGDQYQIWAARRVELDSAGEVHYILVRWEENPMSKLVTHKLCGSYSRAEVQKWAPKAKALSPDRVPLGRLESLK